MSGRGAANRSRPGRRPLQLGATSECAPVPRRRGTGRRARVVAQNERVVALVQGGASARAAGALGLRPLRALPRERHGRAGTQHPRRTHRCRRNGLTPSSTTQRRAASVRSRSVRARPESSRLRQPGDLGRVVWPQWTAIALASPTSSTSVLSSRTSTRQSGFLRCSASTAASPGCSAASGSIGSLVSRT
jgi:hypothetical protein